jgi:hypothetical protein
MRWTCKAILSPLRVAISAGVLIVIVGCGRTDGWASKALDNEKVASAKVGGFSDSDKRLYHRGLQHIANAHQRAGAFTIGQVVDQERNRESRRAVAAVAARVRREAAVARAQNAQAHAASVSAYAKDIALIFQLDYAASRQILREARAEDLTAVYGTASQALGGIDMLSGIRGKMPSGFERTQQAVDDYLSQLKRHYEAAREMVNNPSPKTNNAFQSTVGGDYGAHYVAAIFKAYDNDLAKNGFTGSLRTRLRSRIRGD